MKNLFVLAALGAAWYYRDSWMPMLTGGGQTPESAVTAVKGFMAQVGDDPAQDTFRVTPEASGAYLVHVGGRHRGTARVHPDGSVEMVR